MGIFYKIPDPWIFPTGLFTRRPGKFFLGWGAREWSWHRPGEYLPVPGEHLLVYSPGDQEIFSWGGGLGNEVDIDQENISHYQENISWSVLIDQEMISWYQKNISWSIHQERNLPVRGAISLSRGRCGMYLHSPTLRQCLRNPKSLRRLYLG